MLICFQNLLFRLDWRNDIAPWYVSLNILRLICQVILRHKIVALRCSVLVGLVVCFRLIIRGKRSLKYFTLFHIWMNQIHYVVLLVLVDPIGVNFSLTKTKLFWRFRQHGLIQERNNIFFVFFCHIFICAMSFYSWWLTVINQSFTLGSLSSCHHFLVLMTSSLTELVVISALNFLHWLLFFVWYTWAIRGS